MRHLSWPPSTQHCEVLSQLTLGWEQGLLPAKQRWPNRQPFRPHLVLRLAAPKQLHRLWLQPPPQVLRVRKNRPRSTAMLSDAEGLSRLHPTTRTSGSTYSRRTISPISTLYSYIIYGSASTPESPPLLPPIPLLTDPLLTLTSTYITNWLRKNLTDVDISDPFPQLRFNISLAPFSRHRYHSF